MLTRHCTSSSRWCILWHAGLPPFFKAFMEGRLECGSAPRSMAFFTRPLVCAMYTTATSTLYELRSAPSEAVLVQSNEFSMHKLGMAESRPPSMPWSAACGPCSSRA